MWALFAAQPGAMTAQVRAEAVKLPPGAVFVIANSLTPSLKAETASTHYNMRVVECRLAAAMLAVKLGEAPEKVRWAGRASWLAWECLGGMRMGGGWWKGTAGRVEVEGEGF